MFHPKLAFSAIPTKDSETLDKYGPRIRFQQVNERDTVVITTNTYSAVNTTTDNQHKINLQKFS